MANFLLTWTPSNDGTSSSQNVQYKKSIDSTWTTYANVSSATNTTLINSLLDNVIYNFRISNICTYGGTSESSSATLINFACPSVTLGSTVDTVTYSFTHPGGSISGFTVELLDAAGTTVLATDTPSISGTISGSFTGLTASTTYKVRVKMTASTFNNTCAAEDVFTTAA